MHVKLNKDLNYSIDRVTIKPGVAGEVIDVPNWLAKSLVDGKDGELTDGAVLPDETQETKPDETKEDNGDVEIDDDDIEDDDEGDVERELTDLIHIGAKGAEALLQAGYGIDDIALGDDEIKEFLISLHGVTADNVDETIADAQRE